MQRRLTIYEMYVENGCRYGFYVRRDSWAEGRFAKVVEIEFVRDGEMIPGKPPYFGGFLNPPGHRRAGKKMGPRRVTIEAPWLDGGKDIIDDGGNYCWNRVEPNQIGQ